MNKSSFLDSIKLNTNSRQLLFSGGVAVATLIGYYLLRGKSNLQKRKDLQKQLKEALENVRDLEEKLISLEIESTRPPEDVEEETEDKIVRIWMDGAFDMTHYGHMNAFRQGRSKGTYLIVGVNSDESITQCKGAPVMNDAERLACVESCRWVDEVIPNVPYVMNDEYLRYVLEDLKVDYVVHGDDPCLVNGKDVYENAQKLGKYRTIPRTEGISTTDIVGRMLMMTRQSPSPTSPSPSEDSPTEGEVGVRASSMAASPPLSPSSSSPSLSQEGFTRRSNFMTTTNIIRLFGAHVKPPSPGSRIVYVAGAWDMLHKGHIDLLKEARKYGDYVIVGVHGDEVVSRRRGQGHPVLSLNERVLSVLGCKYVDDVLLDAPLIIHKELLAYLNISLVLTSSSYKDPCSPRHKHFSRPPSPTPSPDPFSLPRQMGILREIEVNGNNALSVEDIVNRIHIQKEKFSKKFSSKSQAELAYYEDKHGDKEKENEQNNEEDLQHALVF